MCQKSLRSLVAALLLLFAVQTTPSRGEDEAASRSIQEEIWTPPLPIFAYLVRPVGDGPFPLAIMNHGVAMSPTDRSFFPLVEFRDAAKWFAERGYLVVAPVGTGYGAAAIDIPDTGTLHGDVRQFLVNACAALQHPLASRIVPDLLAEATRNTELAESLLGAIRNPRRTKAGRMLQRAIDRGELASDIDLEIGLDLLAGPLYWRLVVLRSPADDEYFDRLTDKIICALKA